MTALTLFKTTPPYSPFKQVNWYRCYHKDYLCPSSGVSERPDRKCAKQNRTPLFVKEGALIPMLMKNILNTEQAYGISLEIRNFCQADGSCDVCADDEKTFDYETAGTYRIRSFSMKKGEQRGQETISGKVGISLFGPVAKWTSMTP